MKLASTPPAAGSRWSSKQTGLTARVMSAEPIEGWVVVRYRRAAPFLVHVNDWDARFIPAAAQHHSPPRTPGAGPVAAT
jgi:hypothetical protein